MPISRLRCPTTCDIAPYTPAGPTDEVSALTGDTHRPVGTNLAHGWVTAKALAAAVWAADATTATATQRGLDGLTSWFDPHFAPRYDVRAGTHSRTPDGILLAVHGGALAPDGGFRTDTFRG